MALATPSRTVSARPYRGDEDWRRLHDLLAASYRRTRRWRNWTPDRIDGYLRGLIYDQLHGTAHGWERRIRLWETSDGDLVGAVHHEGPEEAWLELDPDWLHLAPQLLAWAEASHMARHWTDDPAPALQAYATADDMERQALLASRGYLDRGPMEVLHGRSLAAPSPAISTPAGYTVRRPKLDDHHDREQLIAITRLVFGATFDGSAIDLEARMRTERDYLVAETDDGTFAAWCGVWAVPEIGAGQFEPVGTHPEHRRRGLASLVMSRGMDWMRQRGLGVAFVGTGVRNPSNQLYASLGFEVAELYHQWEWLPPPAEAG